MNFITTAFLLKDIPSQKRGNNSSISLYSSSPSFIFLSAFISKTKFKREFLNKKHIFFQKSSFFAEALQVSPKTIDYRIQQALKQLRVDLKDYLPFLPILLKADL